MKQVPNNESSSRRKFIKGCFATAGVTVVGGWSLHSLAGIDATNIRRADVYRPRYLELESSGELEHRERALWEKLERCNLCPRQCGANRTAGRQGVCGSDNTFKVASHGPHFGEETPFVGRRGSGTIFFSNCNLLCVFCQNWEINHRGDGRVTTPAQLANMMIGLQRRGCYNINVVTPTHIVPHIVSALRLAIAQGLNIPLLYNTGGYDSLDVIKLLDGIVDIYLPDFKYQNAEPAARFSQGAPDYPLHVVAAIKEMHRQVSTLQIVNGVAQRGLLIRHLVLPENVAGTDEFVRWVVSELGSDTHVNIMAQYSPLFRASEYPPIDRRLTRAEMNQAMQWAREAGLHNFH
jgi:putative pyruvate formate lyase activating enzyme